MVDAFVAGDAMDGLAEFGDGAVVSDEEGAAALGIVGVADVGGEVVFVEAFVEMGEDCGDVEAVRAWHAICTG